MNTLSNIFRHRPALRRDRARDLLSRFVLVDNHSLFLASFSRRVGGEWLIQNKINNSPLVDVAHGATQQAPDVIIPGLVGGSAVETRLLLPEGYLRGTQVLARVGRRRRFLRPVLGSTSVLRRCTKRGRKWWSAHALSRRNARPWTVAASLEESDRAALPPFLRCRRRRSSCCFSVGSAVLRTLDKLSTMSMFSSVPTERIGGGDGDGAASGLSAREGPVSLCILSGELFGLGDETVDS